MAKAAGKEILVVKSDPAVEEHHLSRCLTANQALHGVRVGRSQVFAPANTIKQ